MSEWEAKSQLRQYVVSDDLMVEGVVSGGRWYLTISALAPSGWIPLRLASGTGAETDCDAAFLRFAEAVAEARGEM